MKTEIMLTTKSVLSMIVSLKGNETKHIDAFLLQDLHEWCCGRQPSVLSDMHSMIEMMEFPCKEEALDVIQYYCNNDISIEEIELH